MEKKKTKTVFLKNIIYLNGKAVMPDEKGVELEEKFADRLIRQRIAMTMEDRATSIKLAADQKKAEAKKRKDAEEAEKKKSESAANLIKQREKVMRSKRKK